MNYIKNFTSSKTEEMKKFLKKQFEKKIIEFVKNQKIVIKQLLVDKEMPKCVQKTMDDIIEENFPILEEEI